ncbi:restriction endonuclease subunit S [Sphingomonas sp. YL-JM2C]
MSVEALATCSPPSQGEIASNRPANWQAASLGDVVDMLTAGVSVNADNRQIDDGEIGVLKTSCVSGGHFAANEHKAVLAGEVDRVRTPVRAGSIIISRMNTPALVGANAYVDEDRPDLFLPDRLWQLRTNHRADCRWLSYYMQSSSFRRFIDDIATGTSGSMKNISKERLLQASLALPPLDEQRRIAEVLRSVDKAIAANRVVLDQVTRARAAILHMAFEETLWETIPLGELGSWQSGGTPSKADGGLWGGDIPWVCPRDMKAPVIRKTHSTLTRLALRGSCKLVPKGTLMIVVRGMILAKAIPTATTAMDATLNQDMKAFRPNGRALPKFVQLCLQHQERQLLRVVNTATHGTKKLDTDTLLAVSVPLPDLETQQALADAVTDLDISSIKYGEEHIRLSTIKQALMADLLSGRARVPA